MNKRRFTLRIKKVKRRRSDLYHYLHKPFNMALIAALIVGLTLIIASHGISTVLTYAAVQEENYNVTPAGEPGLPSATFYPNVTAILTFSMPQNAAVHYLILGTITIIIPPDGPGAPGGPHQEFITISQGNVTNGQSVRVSGGFLPFAVSTIMSIYSLSGGSFTVNMDAVNYFNSTVNFDPPYAIGGLAMTTGSLILIATITGIRPGEF